MQTKKGLILAWVAIYGAITGVMSYVPLIPYITGGGFLPLSIPLAAIAPLLLGFGPGVLAALIGGLIGMFINPVAYLRIPVKVGHLSGQSRPPVKWLVGEARG